MHPARGGQQNAAGHSREVRQAHPRSKELPVPASDSQDPTVCSVLTSVNGRILLEHHVVSYLEK